MINMTHEDYVSFEQAKVLKELGFDWGCNHYYGLDQFLYEETKSILTNYSHINDTYLISAPTLAQVHKWFREVKGIIIGVDFDDYYNKFVCHVYKKLKSAYSCNLVLVNGEDFDTYEQAFYTGIDKAIGLLKEDKILKTINNE